MFTEYRLFIKQQKYIRFYFHTIDKVLWNPQWRGESSNNIEISLSTLTTLYQESYTGLNGIAFKKTALWQRDQQTDLISSKTRVTQVRLGVEAKGSQVDSCRGVAAGEEVRPAQDGNRFPHLQRMPGRTRKWNTKCLTEKKNPNISNAWISTMKNTTSLLIQNCIQYHRTNSTTDPIVSESSLPTYCRMKTSTFLLLYE